MWIKFLNNPAGRTVGDCSVRAVSKALNISWEEAYIEMCKAGLLMGDMPSSDSVWGAVLRQNGFYRQSLPNRCLDCYTVEDFCRDHPEGIYVLGFGGHVATVVDGNLYDSWDSRREIPIYMWFRKEEG